MRWYESKQRWREQQVRRHVCLCAWKKVKLLKIVWCMFFLPSNQMPNMFAQDCSKVPIPNVLFGCVELENNTKECFGNNLFSNAYANMHNLEEFYSQPFHLQNTFLFKIPFFSKNNRKRSTIFTFSRTCDESPVQRVNSKIVRIKWRLACWVLTPIIDTTDW